MRNLLSIILLFGVGVSANASEDLSSLKFFETKVRPLLAAECYQCHGEEKAKGDLRLDHLDFILEGGMTGPAIEPHDVDASLLIQAVRREDPDFSMPPKKSLTEPQIAVLAEWVAMGAPWPEEEATIIERDENGFTQEDREWWAIQPVADVSPPKAGIDWAKNEIDHFIARKLEENDLEPAREASAEELVRRLHFDLHGLPPSREAVELFTTAFTKNPDQAVADEVDALLDSRHYGERWGQHWLDVVRYAESDGYRADDFRPDSWRYRDYVIRSFNENKPYDQFVREQLSADEFAGEDPETLIATAFLRLGIYEWNQRNAEMQWDLILTEMTNVTSEAFLGLGMGCAQCHDHKFDPILQKDYFALQAFLNSTWWPESKPFATEEEKTAFAEKESEWKTAAAPILEQLESLTKERKESSRNFVVGQFPEEVQAMYRKDPTNRSAYEEQVAQLVQRQVDHKERRLDFKKEFAKDKEKLEKYNDLQAQLAALEKVKPTKLPLAFITTDVGRDPATTFLKTRKGKTEVEPAFLTLLDKERPTITPTESTTGRRSALADWIADETNPFSTRVVVNRIWQRHFGEGLVSTPNDFGRLGDPPSHPELLDWLTVQFLEGGWEWKPIHRLITNSATYRQTARREPSSLESEVDPENRLLWRFSPQRLDAEQIRDAKLAVSGELQKTFGGPSVDGATPRRSVYVRKRRNTKDQMIGGFDAPSGFSSAPTRVSTTTPNQSLMLINGEWSMKRSKALATRLLRGKDEISAEMIHEAYAATLGREPDSGEISGALAFLDSQQHFVGAGPAKEEVKYPNENGLRSVDGAFKAVRRDLVGEKALWIQPGSRFERLEIEEIAWPDESFTIEAVANLDRLYKDASVNTLVSRWNGSQEETGWTFGITSEKSRYEPRNFIMQLIGDDFQHNRIYEVVASDLRFPLHAPVYFAAAVSAHPCEKDGTAGKVTFYLKDLSDPEAPLQSVTRSHSIVGGLEVVDSVRALIGSRDQKGHQWDGQLARLTISHGALTEDQLFVSGKESPERVLDWVFSGDNGEEPAPSTAWVRAAESGKREQSSQLLEAMTDFCHALLSSNEFLYLH